MMQLKSVSACTIMFFMLLTIMGCDPCLNNPCDDGVACNGVETCTPNGGQAVCGDGEPVECPEGQPCTEPDGNCVGQACTADEDCDDGDPCTVDTCVDGTCVYTPVECPEGESCDPETGECVKFIPPTLREAAGVYTGTLNCGDNDGEVTLTVDNDTVTVSGFTGNGDIHLTLTTDTTATTTDSTVVAFGTPGHSLTLTLNPLNGKITFALGVAGVCSSTLTPIKYSR